MADTGYGCVFGECTSQPNHLLTTINPPATVSLCDEHYAPGLIPLLASELGVDPGEFYGSVERFLAREAKKAEKAVADAQAAEAAKGSSGTGQGTCGYCGNPLDDGESHLHAGLSNPDDADVPA